MHRVVLEVGNQTYSQSNDSVLIEEAFDAVDLHD
jgi:hypothetical protein